MYLLAINWAAVGVQAGQLLLGLSLLIVLHEFGHYITAKWFGCRVEKFFLFFDPWFALVKKKVGDTVYGIGWLPLGGYVKISGMIDESMDREAMKQPPKPYEFRSKPAWQRLIIMLGGIIMNVLVAFIIYAFVLMIWGETKTPMASLKNGIWVTDSLMYQGGIRNGDKVISVGGDSVRYFEELPSKVIMGGPILIERDGKPVTVTLRKDLIGEISKSKKKRLFLFQPRVRAFVGDFEADDTSYGKKAGLQKMDRITAIDSFPITFYDQMTDVLQGKRNQSVKLTVERKGAPVVLDAQVNGDGKIGIPPLTFDEYAGQKEMEINTHKYGFFEAFPAGVRMTGSKLGDYIAQFKLILDPETKGYKAVGGFLSIGSVFPEQWHWEAFWNITAFLSIILAFMNILPIPALDGGHVMFTLYEMISGRKPNEKFMEYAQMVGLVLLLGLMLYANGNDIIRRFFG